jgi:hypothetical protein
MDFLIRKFAYGLLNPDPLEFLRYLYPFLSNNAVGHKVEQRTMAPSPTSEYLVSSKTVFQSKKKRFL